MASRPGVLVPYSRLATRVAVQLISKGLNHELWRVVIWKALAQVDALTAELPSKRTELHEYVFLGYPGRLVWHVAAFECLVHHRTRDAVVIARARGHGEVSKLPDHGQQSPGARLRVALLVEYCAIPIHGRVLGQFSSRRFHPACNPLLIVGVSPPEPGLEGLAAALGRDEAIASPSVRKVAPDAADSLHVHVQEAHAPAEPGLRDGPHGGSVEVAMDLGVLQKSP
mmetsp:Transcript_47437/g.120134  ORF Transcript_47437/g.120134 Transcript_47437/m.120134 type:complete len:226 (-) Transcript_47437:177-854(-)